jgi:hypothetical protein
VIALILDPQTDAAAAAAAAAQPADGAAPAGQAASLRIVDDQVPAPARARERERERESGQPGTGGGGSVFVERQGGLYTEVHPAAEITLVSGHGFV